MEAFCTMPWVAQRSYGAVSGSSPLVLRLLGVSTVLHVGQAEGQPSTSSDLVKAHLLTPRGSRDQVGFLRLFLGGGVVLMNWLAEIQEPRQTALHGKS